MIFDELILYEVNIICRIPLWFKNCRKVFFSKSFFPLAKLGKVSFKFNHFWKTLSQSLTLKAGLLLLLMAWRRLKRRIEEVTDDVNYLEKLLLCRLPMYAEFEYISREKLFGHLLWSSARSLVSRQVSFPHSKEQAVSSWLNDFHFLIVLWIAEWCNVEN